MNSEIEGTYRENAEVYFYRWLERERVNLNADFDDESTMCQYGQAFSDNLHAEIAYISVPPEHYIDPT